jgi:putative ABC transport system ATP-binding protein
MRDVSREYLIGDVPTKALDSVNIEIQSGEFVAIVGPSGSGKSTLMNLIGCLDQPSTGSIRIAGMETASLEDNQLTALRAQVIGFVFQQFQLLPGTSAIDNVAAPLLYQGLKSKDAKAKAAEVLTQLGLGDRLDYDHTKLSGGQQQRVAIARALATDPTIILADEPTGALDSRSGEAVMEIFQNMHKEGKTIVLITHDLEIAATAERRIHIRDGRIEIDERDQKAVKK